MTNTPDKNHETRLYAVMTDSHKIGDKSHLARVKPTARKPGQSFWTDCVPNEVWLLPRAEAEEVRDKLCHNNPRIVGAKKALARIALQSEIQSPPQTAKADNLLVERSPD